MAHVTVVRRAWVTEASKAIQKKVGALLADAMQEAVDAAVFEPQAKDLLGSDAPIEQTIDMIISNTRIALTKQLQQLGPGPEHDEIANKLYVEMLVRMVASNAVQRHTLLEKAPGGDGTAESPTAVDDAPLLSAAAAQAAKETAAGNKLLQGLLHSFEALQEVHMMDRSHYRTAKLTKQQLSSSAETPGWDTVPLMTLVHLIQNAAQKAGSAVGEEALTQLVRSWRKLLVFLQTVDNGVPPEFSRRRGALSIVNGLLIMLFQHNNTHQCRALLQSVEQNEKLADAGNVTKSVLRPAAHMIAEVVKFRYYQGRMKLYEKKFQEAFESFNTAYRLTPAIAQCSPPQRENKLRIHFYLLVTSIASGQEPPTILLESDPFVRRVLSPIIEAIREGNPVAFCRAVDRNASVLRRRGVYMLLQQARILCYLYLLQRVHSALSQIPGYDNSKISIGIVLDAANLVMGGASVADDVAYRAAATDVASSTEDGEPVAKKSRLETFVTESLDTDAMCLWIARLISRGFVRGYLSYEHKTLVLSKASPFPTISTAPAPATPVRK